MKNRGWPFFLALSVAALIYLSDFRVLSGRAPLRSFVTYVANIYKGANAVTMISEFGSSRAIRFPSGNAPVKDDGPIGVAVKPDGSQVWVTFYRSGTIRILDADGRLLPNQIVLPTLTACPSACGGTCSEGPKGIAFSPGGTAAVVALNGFQLGIDSAGKCIRDNTNNKVAVIDTDLAIRSSNSNPNPGVRYLRLPDCHLRNGIMAPNSPFWVAVHPDGKTFYVSGYCGDKEEFRQTPGGVVSTLSLGINLVVNRYPTAGSGNLGLAIDPWSNLLWIAGEKSNSVTMWGGQGQSTEYKDIFTPKAIAVSRGYIYVASYGPNTECNNAVSPLSTPGIACDNEHNEIVVLDKRGNVVKRIAIRPSSWCGEAEREPCARSGPVSLALSSDEKVLAVTGFDDRSVTFIDTQTEDIAQIKVPDRPFGIALQHTRPTAPMRAAVCAMGLDVCFLARDANGWHPAWEPPPPR